MGAAEKIVLLYDFLKEQTNKEGIELCEAVNNNLELLKNAAKVLNSEYRAVELTFFNIQEKQYQNLMNDQQLFLRYEVINCLFLNDLLGDVHDITEDQVKDLINEVAFKFECFPNFIVRRKIMSILSQLKPLSKQLSIRGIVLHQIKVAKNNTSQLYQKYKLKMGQIIDQIKEKNGDLPYNRPKPK